ncbi:hypothetical protein [Halorussus halobius]|uniref:hypothetical protein n=1 Tax=Halorussus halobius TaxID=1710537 RepID=UPI0010924927|nr:hypothetical protein [Halorussus halobius]
MNSNRCSKPLTVLLVLVLAVSAVGPATALSVSAADAPSEAEVGEEIETTFTLERPFSEYEEWTLNGETNLSDVTWTVKLYDQAGDKLDQQSYDGTSFNHSLEQSDAFEVEVVLEGTVTEVAAYSYDPAQQTLLAELNQVRDGGSSDTIDAWEFRPYTADSDEARTAIADAEQAIADADDSGADVSAAENTLESAVSAFDHGNFENAGNLASDAQESANSAQQSSQQTQMLLYGGLGLVALVLVVGAVFWYRSQQDDYDKLG